MNPLYHRSSILHGDMANIYVKISLIFHIGYDNDNDNDNEKVFIAK